MASIFSSYGDMPDVSIAFLTGKGYIFSETEVDLGCADPMGCSIPLVVGGGGAGPSTLTIPWVGQKGAMNVDRTSEASCVAQTNSRLRPHKVRISIGFGASGVF